MDIESFQMLLGLPSAIDATLGIINKIRSNKNNSKLLNVSLEDDLKVADESLNEIKKIFMLFSTSFDELNAWKQIHNISNTILYTNFKKSFSYINSAVDIEDFHKNIFPNQEVLNDMKADISRMFDTKQTRNLLDNYKDEQFLHKYVEILKNRDKESKEWHVRVEEMIGSIEESVHYGKDSGKIYQSFLNFYRYNTMCNMYADDVILKGITKYNEVIKELKKELDI